MNILLNALFVFTLVLCILNTYKLIGLMFRTTINLPGLLMATKTTPDKWFLFYVGYFFQAWWWSNYFGII